jgi:hypothetical protein
VINVHSGGERELAPEEVLWVEQPMETPLGCSGNEVRVKADGFALGFLSASKAVSGTLHGGGMLIPKGRHAMDRTRSAPRADVYPYAVSPHVRNKLGEAIRSQYELAGPLPDRLYRLVKELEQRSAREGNLKPRTRDGSASL